MGIDKTYDASRLQLSQNQNPSLPCVLSAIIVVLSLSAQPPWGQSLSEV